MGNKNADNDTMFNEIANLYLKQNLKGECNPLNMILKQMEKSIIQKALFVLNGNQRKVAILLGIKYTTLHEKVKKWDLGIEKQTIFENYLN